MTSNSLFSSLPFDPTAIPGAARQKQIHYLMINPFNPKDGNGINAYYQNLQLAVGDSVKFHVFANDNDEPMEVFRRTVFNYVSDHFSPDEVVIEAPETRAATLLFDRSYKTHVRLHTPMATCQKYEGKPILQSRFSDELRVIAQATVVSAPSHSIAREIGLHLDASRFVVNKNPFFKNIDYIPPAQRQTDVIFMGRNQNLKGAHFMRAIHEYLPNNYKLKIVGKGMLSHPLIKSRAPNITAIDYLHGDSRFEVLANSRVALIPSLYENCSMMMLEALAAGVPVITWKVGGNDEFPQDIVKAIPFDRIDNFVRAIVDTLTSEPPPKERFASVIEEINQDFRNGFNCVLEIATGASCAPYQSTFKQQPAYPPRTPEIDLASSEELFAGKRVLGFTISNEHIEDLWVPALNYAGVTYQMVCRRPLGFRKLWSNPYPLPPDTFTQLDWIADTDALIVQILNFKPHILLTHNGSHPSCKEAMEKIKALNIPIVYSELGWFPQTNHFYFDRWGVNGASSLAAMDYFSLTNDHSSDDAETVEIGSKDILLAVQLDNDTNLKIFSPRFRSSDDFVRHVIEHAPKGYRILLKPHPLDPKASRFEALQGDNVVILSSKQSIDDILPQVGHVVAINSTVHFQALEYPVNIYVGGKSIINDKGVTIDLMKSDFDKAFTPRLHGSFKRRKAIVAALKRRQINTVEVAQRSLIEEGSIDPAILPLAEAILLSPDSWVAPWEPKSTYSDTSAKSFAPAKAKPTMATLKRARTELTAKNYSLASQLFDQAYHEKPSPNIYREAAEAYLLAGNRKVAIERLTSAAKKLPKNKNLRRRLRQLQRPAWLRNLSIGLPNERVFRFRKSIK